MNQSLLGHIAIGLSSHPENVATESLNYVLKRSAGARNAMTEFLCKIGGEMSGELSFRAQAVGEDGSIPDLIGCNSDGEECLIIEAKFWAGLTDNQPVSYVRRLKGASAKVLLFVVPELRVGLVWQELISRCKEAGIRVLLDEKVSGSVIAGTVSEKHRLAIVSWKVLLSHLMHHANASNDHEAISDIA